MRQLGFQFGAMALCYNYTEIAPNRFKIFTWITQDVYASTTTSTSGYIKSSSIVPCAATTRLRLHALYINLAVRRDYSSPAARTLPQPCRALRLLISSCTRSTSTLPHAATTRHPATHALRQPRLRVPRHIAWLVTRLVAPLVVDYSASQARRRLLHLRRTSGCLGTSHGSSRGSLCRSSSTTSPAPRVRVPRHVAQPVTRLIVDYSVRRDFILRPRWLYFSHAVCRDYLSHGNTGSTSSTSRAATTSSSSRIASTIYLD
jgi:hypothetical protein